MVGDNSTGESGRKNSSDKPWAAFFRVSQAYLVLREQLGWGFIAPGLGLAIDDGVAFTGCLFQLPAVRDRHGASGVFDQARFLKNSCGHRHTGAPRSQHVRKKLL